MSINFQEILKELEYRVENGIIDLTKEEQVTKLVQILREDGVSDANEMAQKARVYFSYINEEDIVKNKKTGNVYVVKKMDPSKHIQPTPKEIQKAKQANGGQLPSDKSTAPAPVKGANVFGKGTGANVFDKPSKPAAGGKQRIIGGKDKTLAKVDTLRSKAFLSKQQPDDATFSAKNKKFQVGPPPPPYKIPNDVIKNAKVPPRHLKALERMMNTKATGETAKLTLTAADGRNITTTVKTAAAGASGALFNFAGADATTTYAKLTLSSSTKTSIAIGGSNGGVEKIGTVASATFALTPSTVTGQTVSSVDLSTQANSQKALSILDAAIDTVTNSRANLGAYQNRFEAAISNLETTSTNLQASRSRILDTDYAKETTNLAKAQIVQQAATAMLAQANQSSQSVLALLK